MEEVTIPIAMETESTPDPDETDKNVKYYVFTCNFNFAIWMCHRCQLSQNVRDSPKIVALIPCT
jgi:hypothetical protein